MLLNRILVQIVPSICSNSLKQARCLSTLSVKCKQCEKTAGNFIPVYKFPYIVPLSIINRLKIYQTALTVASIPLAGSLEYFSYVPNGAVSFALTLGLTGCIVLHSLGYLTQNFIGFIYYNEEKDTVKVSFVNFWGKRKDIEIPRRDIVPINELPITPLNGLFYTFRRFSTQDTLKLNLRFGIILDKEKIKNIL